MRRIRVVVVLLLALAIVGASGCAKTEQEKLWDTFVDAVSEKRADDALACIDFERMAQKAMGEDADSQAALAWLGGVEGAAEMMRGLFREAISQSGGSGDTSAAVSRMGEPVEVITEGDFSTLEFDVDGEKFTVSMERIDGEWKIVDFGDALADVASSQQDEEPEDLPGGPGEYTLEQEGTIITVTMPTDTSSTAIAELEAFRQAIGASEVVFALVQIDNTNGSDETYISGIRVVTEDGDQVEFADVSSVMGDWFLDSEDTALYDQGIELSNRYLNSMMVLPGAKSDAVFVSTKPVSSVQSVWLDGDRMKKSD